MPRPARKARRYRLPAPSPALGLLAALVLALAAAGRAAAQAPAAPDSAAPAPVVPVVSAIRVAGNVSVDSARIVRSFEVPVGARYNEDAARRGIRKLFALGLFTDVWVERRLLGERVELVIHVVERPRLGRIGFEGNRRHTAEELSKKLFLRVGEAYSPTATQSQVDSLLHFYRQEGYGQAEIRTATDSLGANQLGLRFMVREGEKVRITRIEFAGARGVSPKRLRRAMETKSKGLFGGGELKPGNEDKDREKLETYYHDHGYRDARVTGYQIVPGATSRQLTLRVSVEEGPSYRFGETRLAGHTLLTESEIAGLYRPRAGDRYDHSKVDKAAQAVAALYAEKGYLYLSVDPDESVREGDVVDLTLRVAEGRPSNVRFVHVSGNHATREKVIRRELSIHEGDRFRRSALVRSQGDVFRLGLFEDVQVDFAPAESTDVDVNLKVKEKQVGTASAGAGYTSESGLTGFVQLGHNNVLGNNQSVQVTLERGPRRSNYLLSFTEPWFHDTPTLLGFEVFNTRRERDIFEEKRAGGSVRMGRPLPWPDYSRGYVSYRLEDVKTDVLTDVAGSATVSLVDSSSLGRTLRTSSLELTFLRNSTDNPFYPNHGSRLSLTSELAGGVLGGMVDFNKHRLEGRAYFPSGVRGLTTMLRARLGVLAGYGGHEFIPSYETFRLGGANVTDPLRGYDDYQVVPKGNVRLDSTLIKFYTRDESGAIVDSTISYRTTRVRYPGGRWMSTFTIEEQFPIVHPLHGLLFLDAGNTWNRLEDIRPLDLKVGAGLGFRLEIPLLGTIGLDWGYGFHRDDGARFKFHFLLGPAAF